MNQGLEKFDQPSRGNFSPLPRDRDEKQRRGQLKGPAPIRIIW